LRCEVIEEFAYPNPKSVVGAFGGFAKECLACWPFVTE